MRRRLVSYAMGSLVNRIGACYLRRIGSEEKRFEFDTLARFDLKARRTKKISFLRFATTIDHFEYELFPLPKLDWLTFPWSRLDHTWSRIPNRCHASQWLLGVLQRSQARAKHVVQCPSLVFQRYASPRQGPTSHL